MGSAVLTGLSLVSNFYRQAVTSGGTAVDPVSNQYFLAGILVGAMLPYFFGALTMQAVNRSAQAVIVEVRRQFKEIKGLAEGTADADYEACVSMITKVLLSLICHHYQQGDLCYHNFFFFVIITSIVVVVVVVIMT